MEYRIAVINRSLISPSMAGWGWSLGPMNVPRQFTVHSVADEYAQALTRSSEKLKGDWEFRVIEGPPFVLPEPRNEFHAQRKELPHNR